MATLEATLEALMADIIANPADDTPRLVYADLCDELGLSLRAEFIRLQIDYSRGGLDPAEYEQKRKRAEQLASSNNWFNSAGLLSSDITYWYHRGFVNKIRLESWDWLSKHARLLAANPIREVVLTTLPEVGICLDDPGGWMAMFVQGEDLSPWQEGLYGDRPDELTATRCLLRVNWPRIRFLSAPGRGDYMPILTEGE